MNIRKATSSDSIIIAEHMLMAMEEILYRFIGIRNKDKALAFLNYFTKNKRNQYSYQNCYVAEVNDEVVAVINIYDGSELEELRKPIKNFIAKNYKLNFNPENETDIHEMYIDTLSVSQNYRGQGIGRVLLEYAIEEFVVKKHKTLGLLVEIENVSALKLYERVGFKYCNEKILVGKKMLHFQFNP